MVWSGIGDGPEVGRKRSYTRKCPHTAGAHELHPLKKPGRRGMEERFKDLSKQGSMVALVMLFRRSEYLMLHTYMFKSVTAPLPSPHVDPVNSSFMQAGT